MALTSTFVANKSSPRQSVTHANGYFSGTYTAATVNSATAPSLVAAATGGIANRDAVDNMVIAAGVMTIKLGFAPKVFRIINVTDGLMKEKYEGMAAIDHVHTAIDGTRTLEADSGILFSGNNVVVTFATAPAIVTDNDTVAWEAYG